MRKLKRSFKNGGLIITIREGFLEFIEEKFQGKDSLLYRSNGRRTKLLKKDLLVFLMFYLVRLTKERDSIVYLNTSILKKNFLDDYKPYLNFLLEYVFIIHVGNYSVGSHSNKYGITDAYFKKKYTRYKITDENLLGKISHKGSGLTERCLEKNKECKRRRPHLVKHFDQYLEMDIEGASREISEFDDAKYDANSRVINEYECKLWRYSIKKETDDRLHTVISRTNKKLLKYVTYKGLRLGEVDIKTSQPLFLYIILKTIFEGSIDSVIGSFLKGKLGSELIGLIRNNGLNHNELKTFGNLIINKDLYTYLEDNINTNAPTPLGYYYVEKNNNLWKSHFFDTKRELMKNVVMRSFYSGVGDEVEEFKALFSSIFDIIRIINEQKKMSESKSNLSHILQSIEAFIVLDLIAKDVSNKFINIPLFSKHDALITYDNSIDEIKRFFQSRFESYTGINGQKVLKSKSW